ncbi:MAG: hypothetical protein OXN17_17085 [Candidatus Poribacteria bacterium]|nr:hypothetical protein [Candidatus Poribacteria bacterium]MDE0503607.1 hypothetical protein [Candidatus Poribacteria bacterium]
MAQPLFVKFLQLHEDRPKEIEAFSAKLNKRVKDYYPMCQDSIDVPLDRQAHIVEILDLYARVRTKSIVYDDELAAKVPDAIKRWDENKLWSKRVEEMAQRTPRYLYQHVHREGDLGAREFSTERMYQNVNAMGIFYDEILDMAWQNLSVHHCEFCHGYFLPSAHGIGEQRFCSPRCSNIVSCREQYHKRRAKKKQNE